MLEGQGLSLCRGVGSQEVDVQSSEGRLKSAMHILIIIDDEDAWRPLSDGTDRGRAGHASGG